MKAAGFDLSTKSTGVVILEHNPEGSPFVLSECILKSDCLGMDRHRDIILQAMSLIHHWKPDRIVVEGYSLNLKNATSVVPLVELGGLFRFMLMIDDFSWLDPRAGEIKKFVLGNGNEKKNKMLLGVYKRWGFEAKCDDTADAYGCAAIGLAHGGKLKGMTKEMLSVVGQLKIRKN